jgi:hypothetical protein
MEGQPICPTSVATHPPVLLVLAGVSFNTHCLLTIMVTIIFSPVIISQQSHLGSVRLSPLCTFPPHFITNFSSLIIHYLLIKIN